MYIANHAAPLMTEVDITSEVQARIKFWTNEVINASDVTPDDANNAVYIQNTASRNDEKIISIVSAKVKTINMYGDYDIEVDENDIISNAQPCALLSLYQRAETLYQKYFPYMADIKAALGF